MTKKFISLGLIGYPLEYSLSPILHRAALDAVQLDGEYQLYPVPPAADGDALLKQLIEKMRAGIISGLNVTIPHKRTLLPMVDKLSASAKAIGAVNTITLENGKLVGDNTDAAGFLRDLKTSPLWKNNGTALILGAGGAARAVCYGLAQSGWTIHIAARRVDQGNRLLTDLGLTLSTDRLPRKALELNFEAILPILDGCNLIINTTPAGMSPDLNSSAWPKNLKLPAHVGVYDLIYNPTETTFLKHAKNSGCQTRNGLGMLVEQAALSFELWTGLKPDKDAMLEAASQSLN